MAVPAALALLAAADRRPWTAGVLAAIAVLTKPQAVFALPVLGLMLAGPARSRRWSEAIRAAVAGAAVLTAAIGPFVLAGTWPSFLRAVQRLGEHDLVSGTAANLWWIATWAAGSAARLSELGWWGALTRPATMVRISTVLSWGLPNPRTIGTILTVAAIAWAVWRGRRGAGRSAGPALAAWCVLAYFMVSGQVHENHAYLALPLLGLAAADEPGWRPMYWALSAAFFLNLYLFYGFGQTWPPAIDRGWTLVDASLLLAAAYAVLAARFTVALGPALRS
jgi:hypothetical protein